MATLKDVAKEAGLTVSTVSRILNNRGYISDDARQRVKDAMKKLNYRPNELARSLQNKTSSTIGVIVPHIRHPYFAAMIHALEDAAYQRGYRILLCNSQGREEREKEYVEMCQANRVAGIILCSGGISAEPMELFNIPIIALERPNVHCTASVVCDNHQGGEMAAECLRRAGCSHPVYIGSITDLEMPADARWDGFREVCERNHISGISLRTQLDMYNELQYRDLIQQMLSEHPEVDGVFASSDLIGIQVIQVLHEMGLRVPEDVKVVGFDDVWLASFTSPALTTIHQPIGEIAQTAIQLLVDCVEGKSVEGTTVLPVSLVERASV